MPLSYSRVACSEDYDSLFDLVRSGRMTDDGFRRDLYVRTASSEFCDNRNLEISSSDL